VRRPGAVLPARSGEDGGGEAGRVLPLRAVDSQSLTAFTSSLYVAGLVASLVASRVTKAVGRLRIMLMGGALFFANGSITGAAVNITMLIIGCMLFGFGVGFTNQVSTCCLPSAVMNSANQVNDPSLRLTHSAYTANHFHWHHSINFSVDLSVDYSQTASSCLVFLSTLNVI
jgi:MFS family permease